jgi:hypothetical protein
MYKKSYDSTDTAGKFVELNVKSTGFFESGWSGSYRAEGITPTGERVVVHSESPTGALTRALQEASKNK